MWLGIFGIQVSVMTGGTATLIEAVATAAVLAIRAAGEAVAAEVFFAGRTLAGAIEAE